MVKGTKYEQRVAEEVSRPAPEMCIAKGCPYQWSIQMGGRRCCSWHIRAEPVDWPRITEKLKDDEIEMARRPQRDFLPVDVPAVRAKLQAFEMGKIDPRAWAHRLRERERRGSKWLTVFQRFAWRQVLPELDTDYSAELPARQLVPLPGTPKGEPPCLP
jgi:hypothetical protein